MYDNIHYKLKKKKEDKKKIRILEWVAIAFSRGYSPPRDQTWVSYIAGGFFTIWATKKAWRIP